MPSAGARRFARHGFASRRSPVRSRYAPLVRCGLSSDFRPLAILSNGNSGQGDDVVCAHLCPLSPLDGAVELPALGFGETGSSGSSRRSGALRSLWTHWTGERETAPSPARPSLEDGSGCVVVPDRDLVAKRLLRHAYLVAAARHELPRPARTRLSRSPCQDRPAPREPPSTPRPAGSPSFLPPRVPARLAGLAGSMTTGVPCSPRTTHPLRQPQHPP